MKNVLINGGSRGIGRAMVEAFASGGYNVAFTYSKSAEAAKELAEKTGALAIPADSGIAEQVLCAVERAQMHLGSVDILINNAGISHYGLITDTDVDTWNEIFRVCVTGAFLYSKAVLPKMINKKWGRIINITSMWGVTGASCEVAYSAAKAALGGFTKALAKEVGPSGITVNAIAPGVIDTDMISMFTEDDINDLCDSTPVGRIGKPSEIASAALFLAGDSSSFITGEIMNVSGGFIT